MVQRGAGGAGGNEFALYVMDTAKDMREFNYRDDDKFRNLDENQKRAGTDLPTETVAGGGCG